MSAGRGFTTLITELATAIWSILPRWGRWLVGIALVLWLAWTFLIQERHGGASIVVHSVMNRPISYVSVNGNGGGNTLAFDGLNTSGGTAGPYRIEGDTVRIDWSLSATLKQREEQGLRTEKHSMTLPMPRRNKGQNDFCVLFLPDNTPIVRWTVSCHLDMEDVIEPYRTRKEK